MKQSKTVVASKPGLAGRTPGKKKAPHNHNQESHQNNGHQFNGLDKYFQVLPLVEKFLNETRKMCTVPDFIGNGDRQKN